MQANEGENKTERPMWAEKGGLDFEGRARWDAWTANKGMASQKAKLLFVKVRWLKSRPPPELTLLGIAKDMDGVTQTLFNAHR